MSTEHESTQSQRSDHPHEFTSDGGRCLTCGKTVSQLMAAQAANSVSGGTGMKVSEATGQDNRVNAAHPASGAASRRTAVVGGTAAVATSEPQDWRVLDKNMIYHGDKFVAITTNPRCAEPIVASINAAITAEREKHDVETRQWLAENLKLTDDLIAAQATNMRLVEALEKARKTIAALHGTEPWDGWDIYVKHSPEMKQIDAALERAKEQP